MSVFERICSYFKSKPEVTSDLIVDVSKIRERIEQLECSHDHYDYGNAEYSVDGNFLVICTSCGHKKVVPKLEILKHRYYSSLEVYNKAKFEYNQAEISRHHHSTSFGGEDGVHTPMGKRFSSVLKCKRPNELRFIGGEFAGESSNEWNKNC